MLKFSMMHNFQVTETDLIPRRALFWMIQTSKKPLNVLPLLTYLEQISQSELQL